MASRIDWRHIDEQVFNDLVEALLVHHETAKGAVAQALDGRGGDGGIDVDVRARKTDQIISIYQLKYFPGGMSGGFSARRRQVKKSLLTAVTNEAPPVWVLVLPVKVTAPERKAVRAMLPQGSTRIRFMGPPELDRLLGLYPEIEKRFLSDHIRDMLEAVNRPEASLTKADDLATEALRIREQLDARSEYWGAAFGIRPDGTYHETIYAKRDDAHLREPLNIKFNLGFDKDQSHLVKQFTDAMRFGVVKDLIFPSPVVRSFSATGPAWWARESLGGELHLIARESDTPHSITLVSRDETGSRLARLAGSIAVIDQGSEGISLAANFPGGLRQVWRLPRDVEKQGEVDFSTTDAGEAASDVLNVLQFLQSLEAGTVVDVAVDNARALKVAMNTSPPDQTEADEYMAALEDLSMVERLCAIRLPIPKEGISNTDRFWARFAAMLLTGQAAALPHVRGFNFSLDGRHSDEFIYRLTHKLPWGFPIEEYGVTIFDTYVYLGEANITCAQMEILDYRSHVEALQAGKGRGRTVSAQATNALPLVAHLPDRCPTGPPPPSKWGLSGLPEHKGLPAHLDWLDKLGTEASSTES
jgi:hypothetical protein